MDTFDNFYYPFNQYITSEEKKYKQLMCNHEED